MDHPALTKISTLIDIEEHTADISREANTASVTGTMEELVMRRIRLLSTRRISWLRKIWTELVAANVTAFDKHMEVDGYLHEKDVPVWEAAWMREDPEMQRLTYEVEETEYLLWSDSTSRLSKLTSIFGLSKMETDMLQACLALYLDPNLARVYAYMQDNTARGYVTEALVARLFGHGHCLLLPTHSPLKIWGLIKDIPAAAGEPNRLECDGFIKNWLLGQDSIDEVLYPVANAPAYHEPLPSWPVKAPVDLIKRHLQEGDIAGIRFFVAGAEGCGRRSYAAHICLQCGLSLLPINVDRIPDSRWPQFYMHAQRQAFLTNAVPAWYGATMPDKLWPLEIQPYPVQFVIGEADTFLSPGSKWIDQRIELPLLMVNVRRQLWRQLAPATAGWEASALEEMVRHYQVTVGQIAAVGRMKTATIGDAYLQLQSDAARRLGNLAQPMNSAFTWDDLVVSEPVRSVLKDFIFEATERAPFWEEAGAKRLFPQGRNLIALFTGEPGTGKTMAAQVIAGALKLDLFRIDMSTVVSKYIGESSKNIERILSRAKDMNVILFFDEADALFGKRTEIKDAHDRYANSDTNYLLQAIEQFPGIVILASNKKTNIDGGFMRRLRYLLDFAKPDALQRLHLWKNILSELAGHECMQSLAGGIERLSGLLEITGAQIKLATLSALFMARRDKTSLTIAHLLKGLERELMKEGKGLGRQVPRDLM